MAGGGHLRAAGELVRRVEQALCAGVARDDTDIEVCGGRGSGVLENGDLVNHTASWRRRWLAARPLST